MSEPLSAGAVSGEVDRLVAEVVAEITDRLHAGEPVDAGEYLARHPELADRLRPLLAALDLLAHYSSSAGPDRLSARTFAGGEVSGTLGDFRLVREVGRGGMGVVYEAEQISLGRRVALKVLPFAAALDARQLQRFKNEAHAAAHLHHTNIVPVYCVGCERGVHFYAMQFIDGRSLASVIAELREAAAGQIGHSLLGAPVDVAGGRAAPESIESSAGADTVPAGLRAATARSAPGRDHYRAVARLAVQAAEALEHAHQLGVVHRDVKPANLLLDGRGKLWVADFGLAHCHGDAAMTMPGDLVGTLRYMSPEQALARPGLIDHRTDVYSLGVTLYELLTLQPAFNGQERPELLQQIALQEVRLPRQHNKAIPADLETIVLRAIEKDPAERYATAQELADELGRFLEDRPIRARRPTPAQRLRKWARRHRSALATWLAVAGVALLALLGVVLGFNAKLRVQRDDARRHGEEALAAQAAGRLTLYAAHTQLAHRDWQDAHLGRVLELLYGEGCPADLRGWEWYYLRGLCHKDLLTLRWTPDAPPRCFAFSPDGRWLAVASGATPLERNGGTLELWDVAGWQKVYTLRGHALGVSGVAFSPDSRWLASGSMDATAKIWETATGREVRTLTTVPDWYASVAFSPDGRRLAVSSWGGGIWFYDTSTWQRRGSRPLHRGPVFTVAFSPDSRLLASAGEDRTVRLWDPSTGEPLRILQGHKGKVQSVAFSPDGQRLASASEDDTVKLWDPLTGRELRTLAGHTGYVMSAAFSPDSRQLASASKDGTVRLWEPASGRATRVLRGHTDCVGHVDFSPDGKRLASCSADGTAKFWDPAGEAQEVYSLPGHPGHKVLAVAFAPDGKALASAARDGTVKLWSVLDREPTRTLAGHRGWVTSAAFSPDGWELASGSYDQTLMIWDRASGKPLHTCTGHRAVVWGVAFSPDGRQLASASGDKTLKLWDAATGHEIRTLRGHTDQVVGVAFSPDGRFLASASADKSVKLWDAASGEELLSFTGHTAPVRGVAFSPDGRQLASASEDGTARLWDAATGVEVFTLHGHVGWVCAVAFSPDGRLASGGGDGAVKFWDRASGHETLTLTSGPRSYVRSLAFSPDGRWLASANCEDGSIKLWEAPPLPGE